MLLLLLLLPTRAYTVSRRDEVCYPRLPCFYVLWLTFRAKVTDANEITPQSNYVTITHNGTCIWRPRFDLSVTHCDVDVTWFPFDVQRCNLEFFPWRITDIPTINITLDTKISLSNYSQAQEWILTRACDRAIHYCGCYC